MGQVIDKQVSHSTLELAKEVKTFLEYGIKCPLQLFLDSQNVDLKEKTENILKNESATTEVHDHRLKPSKPYYF